MSSYDDVISITKFAGINQSGDGFNTDLKYAQNGNGFDTKLGTLRPFPMPSIISTDDDMVDWDGECTLAFLTKRWCMGESGVIASDSQMNNFAVAILGGQLFYKRTIWGLYDTPWIAIPDENGTPVSFSEGIGRFDALTYEMNYSPPEAFTTSIAAKVASGESWHTFDKNDFAYHQLVSDSSTACHYVNDAGTSVTVTTSMKVRMTYDAPVDVLLLANSKEGLFCVYAPLDAVCGEAEEEESILKCVRIKVKPSTDETTEDPDDIKFGCIERYNERIFGSGIDSDPDKIMYCAPNDIFNWEQNNTEPADGAGDIQQPDWDGDKFESLKAYSSSLLCIKKHGVWRISGSNPSEFTMKKMYGEGTISNGSVVVHGYYCYFLTEDGIKTFDGTGTSYLKYGWLNAKQHFFRPDETAIAERFGDYYVVQSDGDEMVLYNTAEGTFNIFPERMAAIKECNGKLYGIRWLQLEEDEEFINRIQFVQLFDTPSDKHDYEPIVWESSWIDLSAKNITKSGFEVYVYLEAEEGTFETNTVIKGKVSIISEKKTKTKDVSFVPNKPKRIRINNSGRLYKLRLEFPHEVDGVEQFGAWNMSAGIQMYLEYDYD